MLNNLLFKLMLNYFFLIIPKYIINSSISHSKSPPSIIGSNFRNFKKSLIFGIELKKEATFNI